MTVGLMLADYPPGAFTGMFSLVVAAPAVVLCLVGAFLMKRAKRQRAARGWLIAGGLLAAAWIGLVLATQVLDLP